MTRRPRPTVGPPAPAPGPAARTAAPAGSAGERPPRWAKPVLSGLLAVLAVFPVLVQFAVIWGLGAWAGHGRAFRAGVVGYAGFWTLALAAGRAGVLYGGGRRLAREDRRESLPRDRGGTREAGVPLLFPAPGDDRLHGPQHRVDGRRRRRRPVDRKRPALRDRGGRRSGGLPRGGPVAPVSGKEGSGGPRGQAAVCVRDQVVTASPPRSPPDAPDDFTSLIDPKPIDPNRPPARTNRGAGPIRRRRRRTKRG